MRKEVFLVFIFSILISLLFFYPVFKGFIPFPGDLLVASAIPYSTNSYDGYGPGGIVNKAQGPDVFRQLFPWKFFVVESFKNGEMPLWNPYNLSGNPMLANFQSGALYPLNIIFFLFDFPTAWTLFIILIPLLSCFFTFLFIRAVGIGKIPSLFGGIVFAFSSYMIVWMEYGNVGHTFLWLPLALFITNKLLQKKRFIYSLLLSIVLTSSFLAGYIQGYFYSIIVITAYFLFEILSGKKGLEKKLIFFFCLGLLFPLLLSSAQLLPTIELFQYSARNNYDASTINKLLNPVWYMITIVIPNFFGHPASRNFWFDGTYIERVSYFGFIPFVFALFSLPQYKKHGLIILFGSLFIISILLSLNLPFMQLFYAIPFPLISTTVPTRILSIAVFSGSILSAIGFDFFLKKQGKKLLRYALIVPAICIFLSWLITFFLSQHTSVIQRNLILPSIFLLVSAAFIFIFYSYKRIDRFVIFVMFFITIFDLFYFFHRITPFSPKKYIYPKTPVFSYLKDNASINRFWGYGGASIENNVATYERLYSPDGYEPLHSKRYGELISTSRDGAMQNPLPRQDANIEPGFGKENMRENTSRQQILHLLGIKYILHRHDGGVPDYITFPESIYKMVWKQGEWQIYENKQVLPRIFLTSDYVVETDKKKIIQKIFDKKTIENKRVVLEEPLQKTLREDSNAKINLTTYLPNKIVIQSKVNTNMLLFLSDTYFPGWKVSVDGIEKKIYRANYSFRAVLLEKGSHEIVFWYLPDSFVVGRSITIFSVVCFIIYFFGYGVVILKKKFT